MRSQTLSNAQLGFPHLLTFTRAATAGAASAADIDALCEQGLGHAVGPLRAADRVGLDVVHQALSHRSHTGGGGAFAPPPVLTELVRAGRLGRKSGSGFHDYTATGPVAAAHAASPPIPGDVSALPAEGPGRR
ncbi:3-hydroxyacyl-CoA dehydrogenase family protein [Streptomyces huasconensis]|uniref:3-hydroxyacyl-CoA dehydrogenase family protein n=1 Tax=Streptomyces TaxID=1883 RepID=UPI0038B55D21|nr:hypothetical protein J2N69_00175 [Streptomyces huasconensis]